MYVLHFLAPCVLVCMYHACEPVANSYACDVKLLLLAMHVSMAHVNLFLFYFASSYLQGN
jgi:hypothetical protein